MGDKRYQISIKENNNIKEINLYFLQGSYPEIDVGGHMIVNWKFKQISEYKVWKNIRNTRFKMDINIQENKINILIWNGSSLNNHLEKTLLISIFVSKNIFIDSFKKQC